MVFFRFPVGWQNNSFRPGKLPKYYPFSILLYRFQKPQHLLKDWWLWFFFFSVFRKMKEDGRRGRMEKENPILASKMRQSESKKSYFAWLPLRTLTSVYYLLSSIFLVLFAPPFLLLFFCSFFGLPPLIEGFETVKFLYYLTFGSNLSTYVRGTRIMTIHCWAAVIFC